MRSTKTPWQVTILTLIVISTSAAFADSSIYGSIRLSARAKESGNAMEWDVMDNFSRLGFRAGINLENGLKSVARIEMGLAPDTPTTDGKTENRLANVGLEGSFGGIYVGTQWSPFYRIVGGTTDLFNVVGAQHIHSTIRLSNVLSYANSFGPATLLAGVVIADHSSNSFEDKEILDTIQLGAKFNIGPVVVGAALDQRAKSTGDGIRLGLAATYKVNETTIAAEFTSTESSIANTENDINSIELYAGIGLGNGNLLQTSIGQSDNGINTPKAISIGYQKKLSKSIKYWIEAMFEDADVEGTEDTNTFVVGLRSDWN